MRLAKLSECRVEEMREKKRRIYPQEMLQNAKESTVIVGKSATSIAKSKENTSAKRRHINTADLDRWKRHDGLYGV